MGWRKIHCPFTHHPSLERICINGVLYYYALQLENHDDVIVCFDVRTEKFKFIDANFVRDQVHDISNLNLINYKGKLGMIYWPGRRILSGEAGTWFDLELLMWVLEDVEKNEWSKYVYILQENEFFNKDYYGLIVGVTATGEIGFSKTNTSRPFYIYYFNPERNTHQIVEIQGYEGCIVLAIVDYVEDLNVNDAKELMSSSLNRGLDIIRKRPITTTPSTPSVKN